MFFKLKKSHALILGLFIFFFGITIGLIFLAYSEFRLEPWAISLYVAGCLFWAIWVIISCITLKNCCVDFGGDVLVE